MNPSSPLIDTPSAEVGLAPGALHFDVNLGCTAEAILGALLDLRKELQPIKRAFHELGLSAIEPVLRVSTRGKMKGQYLDFTQQNSSSQKGAAIWDNFMGRVHHSPLHPVVKALIQKGFESYKQAEKAVFEAPLKKEVLQTKSHELFLWKLVAFAALLQALNPLAVTASALPLCVSADLLKEGLMSEEEAGLLLCLSQGLPVCEHSWPGPYSDVSGVILLKSIAHRFGVRGESVLLKMGCGTGGSSTRECQPLVRALWCEPAVISTRALEGLSCTHPLCHPMVQVTGWVGFQVHLDELRHQLGEEGARHIFTFCGQDDSTRPKTCLTFLVSHEKLPNAVAVFLTQGEASEVTSVAVENHALIKRVMTIPYNLGQKPQSCQLVEYLLGQKILRAEPLSSDLQALSQQTGYSESALRSDVLKAWKKWRLLSSQNIGSNFGEG